MRNHYLANYNVYIGPSDVFVLVFIVAYYDKSCTLASMTGSDCLYHCVRNDTARYAQHHKCMAVSGFMGVWSWWTVSSLLCDDYLSEGKQYLSSFNNIDIENRER